MMHEMTANAANRLQRMCYATISDAFQPLLLTALQAAAMFQKTERTWRTWDSIGKIPRPMRVGRALYWRLEELNAWIDSGCPAREDWENLTKVTAAVALPDFRQKSAKTHGKIACNSRTQSNTVTHFLQRH